MDVENWPEDVVLPEGDLREVLRRGCAERGVLSVERDLWTDRMMEQLYEVGVETVRDFLEGNWTVNSRLATYGYGAVAPSAIKMLNRLCCDSLFDAGMRAGRAEAFHAISSGDVANSDGGSEDSDVMVADDVAGEVIKEEEVAAWRPEEARDRGMRGPFEVLDESDGDSVVAARELAAAVHEAAVSAAEGAAGLPVG
jgi:hypothetical protein